MTKPDLMAEASKFYKIGYKTSLKDTILNLKDYAEKLCIANEADEKLSEHLYIMIDELMKKYHENPGVLEINKNKEQ